MNEFDKGIYAGLDVQDAYDPNEQREVCYKPRPRDFEAHPMLVLGQQCKNGRLEGTHNVIDSLDQLGSDPDLPEIDITDLK